MARQVVVVCDNPLSDGTCVGSTTTYRIWKEGDHKTKAIDLCEKHVLSLLKLLATATTEDLPARPRVPMKVTRLRTTEKTKPFKKADAHDG